MIKADFKATRERVGLKQKEVAIALDVTVSTVKKWENPKYQEIPDDAIKLLEAALTRHQHAVRQAVDKLESITDTDKVINLHYYRSQDHYQRSYPGTRIPFEVINARTREVAVIMEERGYRISYVYPE